RSISSILDRPFYLSSRSENYLSEGQALSAKQSRHFLAVFVASSGEIYDDRLLAVHFQRELVQIRDRMGRFERGENAFQLCKKLEGVQSLVVRDADILDAARILPKRMLRPDAGIIQAGTATVDRCSLAVFVLKDVRERTVKHAGFARRE